MTRLTIYGDFNCPFSALASVRADVLLAADAYEIDWRAVQHDTAIPTAGEAVEGDTAAGLADEVATIADLSDHDVRLHLVGPTRPLQHRRRLRRVRGCGRRRGSASPAALRRRVGRRPQPRRPRRPRPPRRCWPRRRHRSSVAGRVRGAPPAHHPDPGAAGRVHLPRVGRAGPPRRTRRSDAPIITEEQRERPTSSPIGRYGDDEPTVSGRIMERHRDRHHAGYLPEANHGARTTSRRPRQGGPRGPRRISRGPDVSAVC